MVQFSRLRLSGFKSFVDATELLVEPGLTGVVGPNGCGKSNLVEALRWVMGETSPKQMRGSEMDDVIFGGTATRPPRNIAEVSIHLDNTARTAPAMFNDFTELEITRRIERGHGSQYRVNGRDVRARDVQLLFADAATGARSTAMVSQGRVAVLINAKPSERRSLLEEAAGITGLHSRRHEAELRLKAAEANLERLEDVVGALDTQLSSLKRQARQAARYRLLSEQIRAAEAQVLSLRWTLAIHAQQEAHAALAETESQVATLTGAAAAATTLEAEAATDLPAIRQTEAESAARLQRLVIALEQLDTESTRIAELRREAERRWSEITSDNTRERARTADGEEALERLREESIVLEAAAAGEAEAESSARVALHAASAAVNDTEAELTRLTEKLATMDAQRVATLHHNEAMKANCQRLASRITDAETTRAALTAEMDTAALSLSAQRQAEAEARAEAAAEALELADNAHRDARTALDASRDAAADQSAITTRLAAEAESLADLLAADSMAGSSAPVIDAISVAPGFETALTAALGDDLSAAAHRWLVLPPLADPTFPEAIPSLKEFVTAPEALARRLAHVGVVNEPSQGGRLQVALTPGQRLVSRDGDLWRWDGFTAPAGLPSAAATRLKQRNRLAVVAAAQDEAQARLDALTKHQAAAQITVVQAAAAERHSREALRAAVTEHAAIRSTHDLLVQRKAGIESRMKAIDDTLAHLQHDKAEAAAEAEEAQAVTTSLEDPEEGRARLLLLKAQATERRSALMEARTLFDRLFRDSEARRERLIAVRTDAASWQRRLDGAKRQIAELDERRAAVVAELEHLAERPLTIAADRLTLLDQTAIADTARRACADHLAAAETRLRDANRARKEAEHAMSRAREERVRLESLVATGSETCHTVAARISERLGCTPEQAVVLASEGEAHPTIADAEHHLETLLRERENLGPVNLRAEQEVINLEAQVNSITSEREELTAAIAKLRRGIAEINQEGRERLMTAFEAVNRHFRTLFTQLFGGGRAYLALTESNDPLLAGLEIMASPPGKRLQILSLLSGGEQALTALSLLFAVFLTNPAPVCVLDEVDAALDDANVDRLCLLLSEITNATATRFLIITHHRMTMARMDRLFGVTMGERGVSQLVSVDLKAAEHWHEIA